MIHLDLGPQVLLRDRLRRRPGLASIPRPPPSQACSHVKCRHGLVLGKEDSVPTVRHLFQKVLPIVRRVQLGVP